MIELRRRVEFVEPVFAFFAVGILMTLDFKEAVCPWHRVESEYIFPLVEMHCSSGCGASHLARSSTSLELQRGCTAMCPGSLIRRSRS